MSDRSKEAAAKIPGNLARAVDKAAKRANALKNKDRPES